jgi:hypothetical protein
VPYGGDRQLSFEYDFSGENSLVWTDVLCIRLCIKGAKLLLTRIVVEMQKNLATEKFKFTVKAGETQIVYGIIVD